MTPEQLAARLSTLGVSTSGTDLMIIQADVSHGTLTACIDNRLGRSDFSTAAVPSVGPTITARDVARRVEALAEATHQTARRLDAIARAMRDAIHDHELTEQRETLTAQWAASATVQSAALADLAAIVAPRQDAGGGVS